MRRQYKSHGAAQTVSFTENDYTVKGNKQKKSFHSDEIKTINSARSENLRIRPDRKRHISQSHDSNNGISERR